MDKIVKQYYLEYMKDDNYRSLPMDIDGLKLVERRVLLSCYHIAMTKLTKSAKVDGFTIGNYHPHASVYGTIVQMVHQNFLIGQGNFGCDFGIEKTNAAASRYTEVKLNPSMKNLCFNFLDVIPWEMNELNEKEQKFLPTMFPMCFLGKENTEGIGSGYRTIIPCYEFEDLKKRTKISSTLCDKAKELNLFDLKDMNQAKLF